MKNVGNNSRGRSQGVPKIFRAPMYGMYRAHGHLCDSTAFLLLLVSVTNEISVIFLLFIVLILTFIYNGDRRYSLDPNRYCSFANTDHSLFSRVFQNRRVMNIGTQNKIRKYNNYYRYRRFLNYKYRHRLITNKGRAVAGKPREAV